VYLSLFRLSAQKEILIKQQLHPNCASPQNSLMPLPGRRVEGLYREEGLGRGSSLVCTSPFTREPDIPRLGQLEQSKGNSDILEEAEHKAVEGPCRGTGLRLPQVWEAGGKSSCTAGPLPDLFWALGIGNGCKVQCVFLQCCPCFSSCEMARILPFEPCSVEATLFPLWFFFLHCLSTVDLSFFHSLLLNL
jgi:hypothetical protein